MTTAAPARPRWLEWMPVVSGIAIVCGALLTGGGLVNQVQDTATSVAKLEALVDRRDEQLRAIDLRLARIEVKLEMMIPVHKEPRP